MLIHLLNELDLIQSLEKTTARRRDDERSLGSFDRMTDRKGVADPEHAGIPRIGG